MGDKKDLTVEILLTAGAVALADPHSGLAGAVVVGAAELLKAGWHWLRKKSAQGQLDVAIAEIEQEESQRRLVREEIGAKLEESHQAAYRRFLAMVLDREQLRAPEDDARLGTLVEHLNQLWTQRMGDIVALLVERLGPRDELWPTEPWIPPAGALPDRYWWKVREGFPALDNEGFLVQYDGPFREATPNLHALSELNHIPCLVLAGEPGSGKSVEAGKAWMCLRDAGHGVLLSRLDLREYGDEKRLNDTLRTIFGRWELSEKPLWLFLDSLDECRLRVGTAASILARWVKVALASPERVHIRIACRAADLPWQFEELVKEGLFEVIYLAPLRRQDVSQIAEGYGIDGKAFLRRVHELHLGPLAVRPITLRLLMALSSRGSLAKQGHRELYLHGCRQLCTETNPSRRDHAPQPQVSPNAIMEAAEWIAAVLIFSNRRAVYSGADVCSIVTETDSLVPLSMFESWGSGGPSPEALRRALESALFVGVEGGLHVFAHQTYAEFLAARLLLRRKVPAKSIFRLLMDSGTKDGQVIPQLAETAAWLADDFDEVFDSLIESDPKVLLNSALLRVDDKRKQRVAQAILEGVEHGKFPASEIDFFHGYGSLKCQEVAQELRPWILDSERDILGRRVAIDMARECRFSELLDAYVQVMNNPKEPPHVRSWCSWAVVELKTQEGLDALKPFLAGRDDDTDDELKGHALEAWWPDHLATSEIVSCLTPRKRKTFHGAYAGFLQQLPNRLRAEDLPVLLPWVGRVEPMHRGDFTLAQVAEEILEIAWRHVNFPGVAWALAETAFERAVHHESIVPAEKKEKPPIPEDSRQLVVAEVVRAVSDSRLKAISTFIWHQPSLIRPVDMPLVLRLEKDVGAEHKLAWAEIVANLNNTSGWSYWDDVWDKAQSSPELHHRFKDFIDGVAFRGPAADEMRKKWEESERQRKKYERMDRRYREKVLDPPPRERVRQWLDKAEAGNSNAWWVLNHELTLKPTSTHYEDVLEPDLTLLPGWEEADENTRNRLLAVARTFINIEDSKPGEWLGKNTYLYSALAGYRAILLLLKLDPAWITRLPTERWEAWAASLVGYPSGINSPDHHEMQPRLVQMAYERAPDAVLSALDILLRTELKQAEFLPTLRTMKYVRDERFGDYLLRFAEREDIPPASLHEVMALMVRNEYQPGIEKAASLLRDLEVGPREWDLAKAAAVALLLNHQTCGWDLLWPVFQAQAEFGRQVFLQAVHPYGLDDRRTWAARLNPTQVADLYVALSDWFPRGEDPQDDYDGMHAVTERESVAHVRDGLISHLANRGEPTTVSALESLVQRCTHEPWLRQTLLEVRRNMRRLAWRPVEPIWVLDELRSHDGSRRADHDA